MFTNRFEQLKLVTSFRLATVSFLLFTISSLFFLFSLSVLHGHPARDIWNRDVLRQQFRTFQPHLEGRATPKQEHEYLSNGLLKTNLEGRHPMSELIAQAEKKWNALKNRQSKTLEKAKAEYKRRYNRSPPPGFDDWYAFAVNNNFILIDEFDQINRDIAPLLAMPHSALLERLEEAREISEQSGFIVNINPAQNNASLTGPAFSQMRVRLFFSLILAISRGLSNLTLYGSGEDRSGRILGGEMREWIAEGKGEIPSSLLQKFEDPFRDGRKDIFSACLDPPSDKLVHDASNSFQEQDQSPTFIHEPSLASDFCLNPPLVHLHGSLAATHIARGARLFPEFVFGKLPLGSEILLPDTAGFDPFTLKQARPWSEKTYNKLFWRGLTTGGSYRDGIGGPLGWKGGSQRIRATFTFSNNTASESPSYLSKNVHILSQSSMGNLEIQSFPRTELNTLYADVGVIQPPIQCSEEDGTCDAMRSEVPWREGLGIWGVERSRWKYVLDLDSNGHSGDLETSLGLGSVVLKTSFYPHWNSDWLIPYYHYIPIQQDFSDVYNIMAFFAGPPINSPDGLRIDASLGHDELAREIGENAERFVRTTWRWEDMQVYVYRLLLEYARLVEDKTADDL